MCDPVREMSTPGRARLADTQTPSLSLSPSHLWLRSQAGGDTCQFPEDQAGINILRHHHHDHLHHPRLLPPPHRTLAVRRGEAGPLQIRLPQPGGA